jgi:hypothetical protein
MRSVRGRRLERPLNNGGHLVVADAARPARTGLVQKSVHSVRKKPAPPFAHRVLVHGKFSRNDLVLQPIGAAQHDPASLRQRSRNTPPAHLSLQISALLSAQNQGRHRTTPRTLVRHQNLPFQWQNRMQ